MANGAWERRGGGGGGGEQRSARRLAEARVAPIAELASSIGH